MEANHTSLEEKPFWKRVINFNAIALMTVAIFFWAFFYWEVSAFSILLVQGIEIRMLSFKNQKVHL